MSVLVDTTSKWVKAMALWSSASAIVFIGGLDIAKKGTPMSKSSVSSVDSPKGKELVNELYGEVDLKQNAAARSKEFEKKVGELSEPTSAVTSYFGSLLGTHSTNTFQTTNKAKSQEHSYEPSKENVDQNEQEE